jgi:hypothetical protein
VCVLGWHGGENGGLDTYHMTEDEEDTQLLIDETASLVGL